MKDYSKPAFPSRSGMMFYVPGEHKEAIQHTIEAMDREHEGMTLRDYFAAKALSGISAHSVGPAKKGAENSAQAHARWAYQVADAMLVERAA